MRCGKQAVLSYIRVRTYVPRDLNAASTWDDAGLARGPCAGTLSYNPVKRVVGNNVQEKMVELRPSRSFGTNTSHPKTACLLPISLLLDDVGANALEFVG